MNKLYFEGRVYDAYDGNHYWLVTGQEDGYYVILFSQRGTQGKDKFTFDEIPMIGQLTFKQALDYIKSKNKEKEK